MTITAARTKRKDGPKRRILELEKYRNAEVLTVPYLCAKLGITKAVCTITVSRLKDSRELIEIAPGQYKKPEIHWIHKRKLVGP